MVDDSGVGNGLATASFAGEERVQSLI